jgi:hypothetical protein
MENKIENRNKEIIAEKNPLIIGQKKFKDFIEFRKIKDEDFPLIEKMTTFPKELIIMELHNLFNMNHERSGEELERFIKNTTDEEKKDLYQSALNFYNKYGWATSYNLVRVLEGEI